MAIEKIIVLDDEMVIRNSLQDQLRKRRYSVATAGTIAEAEKLMGKDSFDLIFVDIGLPDGKGTDLLESLKDMPNAPMVVMMTGDSSIKLAVECIKNGAFDYIIKPFHIEQIEIAIKKAESFDQLIRVNQYFSDEMKKEDTSLLLGQSEPMKKLREMVRKVAATEATVLVYGENGTGKELIAHELWAQSSLADKPYIKVNCAAISENLMESEFFGHEKGAFTGATQRREGRFELANGGTILLDEISEITPRLQAKLLRVLQEKEFERVGGNKTLSISVRVIATTNRDMMKAVADGEFREDLYYRLNVFPLYVPALRERDSDIAYLAEKFLKKFSVKHGKKEMKFTKKALNAIKKHSWPGNVRELQNTVERAVILADDGKSVSEMELGLMKGASKEPDMARANAEALVPESASGLDLPSMASLHEMEKQHILRALDIAQGKHKQAAEMLDISMRTLKSKLNQIEGDQATG